MMFLFAGHSAGLLSKNFVKQRLHENFRIPAPWLTKEIIFVCTVFLFLYTVNALWEDAYTCPIYAMNQGTSFPRLLEFHLHCTIKSVNSHIGICLSMFVYHQSLLYWKCFYLKPCIFMIFHHLSQFLFCKYFISLQIK